MGQSFDAPVALRTCFQSLTIIVLLTAVGLSIGGMFGAAWLVSDFGFGDISEHGLVRNCDRQGPRAANIRTYDEYLCFWKFDIAMRIPTPRWSQQRLNLLFQWQIDVMILLGVACIAALIASLLGCLVCCCPNFCVYVSFFVLCFCSFVLSLTGMIVFARWAYESEFRFFRARAIDVEQVYGPSFYLAMTGCIMFGIAGLLAALCFAASFFESRTTSSSNKSLRSYRITSV